MTSVTTTSQTRGIDGTVTDTAAYTIEYTYAPDSAENRAAGWVGHLWGAELVGEIHSVTTDAFGNVTESFSKQTFTIIGGQAKMTSVETRSQTRSTDGSVTITDPSVIVYS